DWASKEAELTAKRVDLLWNGLTITDQRKEKIDFSEPYMHNDQIIVTLKSRADLKDIDSLAGKIVGTQEGGTGIDALAKLPDLKNSFKELRLYAVYTDALMDLEIGRIDAVLVDGVVGRYYMTKKPDTFYELPNVLATEVYGVGMRKDSAELKKAIDRAIGEIKADGTGEKISKKWFGKDVMN
ncbi:MAG: transporter substrate-binding domain-containing protein, partial [Negativicoccus succinicivorans]|nr:transporter substrate-binding domain-containing protein [Negativicoccus succinicivorans]